MDHDAWCSKPQNIINFKEASIYICPSGVAIGTIVYPPGFSFTYVQISATSICALQLSRDSAEVAFLGVNGSAHVSVDSTGVIAKGSLDNFKLGPLAVRGTKGPSAGFDLELSASKQLVTIDGMIKLLGSE